MARPAERDPASRGRQALVIQTARLLIRLPLDEDAQPFLDIHTDPDVIRWLGGPRPKTLQDERDRIARGRAMHEELGFTMWTAVEKATGEVVGLAGLFPVEGGDGAIEVAYHFRKDRWGRGYATEAARACLDYGFSTGRLDRVVGLVHPDNHASRRVLEKCGMTYEGRGRYYDMDLLIFALERPG
ncbi:MAG TPA: GNAT family N-acetyltransferase [Actinomycetota bacterium]|nr:GNAT family N-acetyltransferase [Actinomycetota bacterium]